MYRIEVGDPVVVQGKLGNFYHYLVVDGEVIGWTSEGRRTYNMIAQGFRVGEPMTHSSYHLSIMEEKLFGLLSVVKLHEISPEITDLSSEYYKKGDSLYYYFSSVNILGERQLKVTITFFKEEWKGLWTMGEFADEMEELVRKSSTTCSHIEIVNAIEKYVELYFPIESENSTLEAEIQKHSPEFENIVSATEQALQAKIDENSFVHYFKFPEGLQGACEEYLWSFIQFLKEVGVEATGELKQDQAHAGKVLFAVTPTRGKAVLGKVKQALELYIHLAGTSNFEFDPNAPIAADIIQARISAFQSQLSLATASAKMQLAEIRANEATIQAQATTIQSQQVMLDRVNANNVFLLSRVESLEDDISQKSQDQIRLLNGIVKLGDASKYGVSVNIPRLLAAVKRAMQDDSIPAIVLHDLGLPALPPYELEKD